MDRIQIPAILDGASSLRDGGLSVRFHTQELSPEEKAKVMSWLQKFGWLLFDEQEFDDSLELEQVRRDTGGKTPSQRLRNVIHVAYQQSGRIDITFEQFYQQKMEGFINVVKSRLQD